MYVLAGSCGKDTETGTSEFTAYSAAFENNGTLPRLYTCDSLGCSPPVVWENAPSGTKAFALTMHHIPDSGDKHVYMVLYNIPPSINAIPQAVQGTGTFGINTVNGGMSYTPPCSSGPGAKVYTITVYALSAQPVITDDPATVTMEILLNAMQGITLQSSTINVTYTRF
jgi:phosphatidylethanolamine-binding protein (PEBP) family uncharacterized protein